MLGENLLIKLWETLTKDGIGSLASPWQIKREGKAHTEVRRNEMLTIAQAEHDIEQIKQGKKQLLQNGTLINLAAPESIDNGIDHLGRIEPIFSLESFSQKAEQRKRVEEIQQEININTIINLAEEELLRSQQEAVAEEVDSDWLLRWRDYAKNTKNDELRNFWARTLAGEIKSPGSYSLRTLDFIKNLSQDEAISISKLGKFSISNFIFKCPILAEKGIDFNFLLQMDDLGVLSGVQGGEVSGLTLNLKSQSQDRFFNVITNRNKVLLVESDDQHKTLSLGCYKISRIGTEILSLGDFEADEDYMKNLGQHIKTQGFNVKIALWTQTSNESGRYFHAQDL